MQLEFHYKLLLEGYFMKHFKSVKYIQLGLLALFIFFYAGILFFIPNFRYTVFTNPQLLILCVLMWILCVTTLCFTIYDIQRILELEITHHELNKEAYLDELTGIPNRHGVDSTFASYDVPSRLPKLGCVLIWIENINEINDQLGRTAGNNSIQRFSELFEKIGDSYGFVARNGGNEYLALFDNCDKFKIESFIKSLRKELSENSKAENIPEIKIKYSSALNSELNTASVSELIGAAYRDYDA